MSFTSGPWTMEGPQIVGNGYGIGHVTSHSTSEGKANARLISAAPDLLTALQVIADTDCATQREVKIAAIARAAIAKAVQS